MSKKHTPAVSAKKNDRTTDFYEAMPMTAGPYSYQDDIVTDVLSGDDYDSNGNAADGKFTAIMTLVIVGIITAALAFLFWRGLDAINGAAPTQQESPSTLQL